MITKMTPKEDKQLKALIEKVSKLAQANGIVVLMIGDSKPDHATEIMSCVYSPEGGEPTKTRNLRDSIEEIVNQDIICGGCFNVHELAALKALDNDGETPSIDDEPPSGSKH